MRKVRPKLRPQIAKIPWPCYRGHLGPPGPKLEKESENDFPGPLGPRAQKINNRVEKSQNGWKPVNFTLFRLCFRLFGPRGREEGPNDTCNPKPRRVWTARIQKYCKSVEKRKLRPWSELTAKMVMGVVVGLVKRPFRTLNAMAFPREASTYISKTRSCITRTDLTNKALSADFA